MKALLKAQQGEMDAVLLYQKLARLTKDEHAKEQFLQIASDEGKHASIIKGYTGKIIRPKSLKSNLVGTLYKVLGHNKTLKILASGEMKSIAGYAKLVERYPKIKEIMDDEERHAKIAMSLMK
ncbi:nodulin 21-related protein [Lachnospiraceae bacterium KM106-2]|nr:nodulin 21-related protein [Lachnospiraceae bacterium KM106-2]